MTLKTINITSCQSGKNTFAVNHQRLILPVLILLGVLGGMYRAQAQVPGKMPLFQMLLTNGKTFSTAEVKHDRPVVLIYFAPDCDHCKTLMNAYFKKAAEFKKADVLMVTFKPLLDVFNFEKTYNTTQHTNIRVGTEKSPLFLQGYYKLQNTPFTALYDKWGTLVYAYKKDTSVDDLLKRLKALK